jgi:ferrous iron transport protein B
LFFTTQLLELGIPVVVALNKHDINQKQEIKIDIELLSKELGCPVIPTVSTDKKGLKEVIEAATTLVGKGQTALYIQEDIDFEDKKAVDVADRKRYANVNKIVKAVEKRKIQTKELTVSDKIDNILTNKFSGLLVFIAVMYAVFNISQVVVGPVIAGWLVGGIEIVQELVAGLLENSPAFLQALLVDGMIGGVGAVVGFLPLVMVMYLLLALLEDCGYMARVSVVMDPIFKRVGLSGKSIIPFIISTGCGIPGIMSCRTIRDERERRATAMLATFMPCGAKIPVISLFSGIFFGKAAWVSTLMYFTAIFIIFIGALLVREITRYKYRKSFFIMEMPEYKIPNFKLAVIAMLSRAKAYLVKAATIILVCNVVVQIMQSFNWQLQLVPEGMEDTSILASVAGPIAVLLVPLGFGAWQLAAASVTGFIAKENVVGTLAVVYAMTNLVNPVEMGLVGDPAQVASIMGLTSASALAYLMFNLFTPPCFAAIGAMNSELNSKKWLAGAISLQFGTGYTVAFLVNQVGTLIMTGSFAAGFVSGLVAVLAMVAVLVGIIIKAKKNFSAEYANPRYKEGSVSA